MSPEGIRLGVCCVFHEQPIKFSNTTVTVLLKLNRVDALSKLAKLCMQNALALQAALEFCANAQIGCFRINSQILPVKTHSVCGYEISELPEHEKIVSAFVQCGEFAKSHNLRTSFHPDQFVVLNSPRPDVVQQSLLELDYQAQVAEWVGADVINIHGGGAYGDKKLAMAALTENLSRLPPRVKSRLTLENDDTTYTPWDLLEVCWATGIPLVYDVHHHRCNPDRLCIEEATQLAFKTWNREPMLHISSPAKGWDGPNPKRHADFINIADFPLAWRKGNFTLEVEARFKEIAVLKLKEELQMTA